MARTLTIMQQVKITMVTHAKNCDTLLVHIIITTVRFAFGNLSPTRGLDTATISLQYTCNSKLK